MGSNVREADVVRRVCQEDFLESDVTIIIYDEKHVNLQVGDVLQYNPDNLGPKYGNMDEPEKFIVKKIEIDEAGVIVVITGQGCYLRLTKYFIEQWCEII